MTEVLLSRSDPHPDAGVSPVGSGERARKPGDVIADKYLLVSYLARGGMAEVWLATHKELRTEVAVKFVHEHLADDEANGPWALERFRFEAQISARMASRTKHVVAVLDAGTHERTPYLVMEYVAGCTLEAEVEENGPMDPVRFADLMDQVADALDAAHAMGIVHRDLKPSNFLLCDTSDEGGEMMVKVADFGVAKAVDSALAVDRPRETQRGEVVGSPAFMSPEQLRGVSEIDPRSDIWSLGVVAYETLTGEECFEGKTIMDTFASISMRKFRPPSTVRPSLPRALDAWVDRALQEDPSERFQSVAEMAQAYRQAIRPAQSSRGPILAGTVLTVAGVAALLVAFGVRAPAPAATPSVNTAAPSGPSAQAISEAQPPANTASTVTAVVTPPSETVPTTRRRPVTTAAAPANTGPRASASPSVRPAPSAPPAPPPPATPTSKGKRNIDPSEIQ